MTALEELVRGTFADHAERNGCQETITQIFDMPPAEFPEQLLDTLSECAERVGLPSRRMLSGAFHDALFMNRVAPSAMIFVPCRDGLSHNELEHVEPEHSISGCQLLAAAVLSLG
jgi:N-carbamoyl-L-amino-acid hydrolase